MSGLERDATDVDLFGEHGGGEDRAIFSEYGTIGYANETALTVLGDASSPDNGVTLVRVTTYRGKAVTERAKPGIAQGHQILCHLLGPLYYVPPRGTRVLVVYPGGDTTQPGVIMGTVGASPFTQFKETRAVLDVGPGEDLVVKARSVTVMDHGKEETPSRFPCWLVVGPVAAGAPSISANDPTGSGFTIGGGVVGMFATDNGSPPAVKAVLELSTSQVLLALNGKGMFQCDESTGNITCGGSGVAYLVGKQCMLGPSATSVTPVVYGPAGISAIGSTTVFCTP